VIPLQIPGGYKAIRDHSPIVRVSLSKCRDILGYAYTPPGWHYYVAFLRQYAEDPGISPLTSVLARYGRLFSPRTFWEALTGLPKQEQPDELSRLPDWPPLPWLDIPFTPANAKQHFGNYTQKMTLRHDQRCRYLYDKIRKEGYLPDQYPDGYIRGYYLADNFRYRFMVTAGQHRIAVLAALGLNEFAAKIQHGFPRVVALDNLREWPQVVSGVYTPEQAEMVFRLYFRLDGSEKARRLGLIGP